MKDERILLKYFELVAYKINNYGTVQSVSRNYVAKRNSILGNLDNYLVSKDTGDGLQQKFYDFFKTFVSSEYTSRLLKEDNRNSVLRELCRACRIYEREFINGYHNWYRSIVHRNSKQLEDLEYAVRKVGFSDNYGKHIFLILFAIIGHDVYKQEKETQQYGMRDALN